MSHRCVLVEIWMQRFQPECRLCRLFRLPQQGRLWVLASAVSVPSTPVVRSFLPAKADPKLGNSRPTAQGLLILSFKQHGCW